MVQSNHTNMKEFFFLKTLFVVFLAVYVGAVLGNALIVVTITCRSHLLTAMYFLLWNESVLNIVFSSVTIPKFLVDLYQRGKPSPTMAALLRSFSSTLLVGQIFFSFL